MIIGTFFISLKKLKTVYPAAGTSNSAVKLTLEELEKVSNYKKWVDVCKKIGEQFEDNISY